MNAHPSSAKLQELCARARNMAADGEGGRRAIAQSGGLALVCAAIGLHAEHPGRAARVLGARQHGGRRFDRLVERAGGIHRVCEALEAHEPHAGVAEDGCSALANLACADRPTRLALVEAGGVTRVPRDGAHPEVVGVQQEGCAAIANLSWGEMQKRDVIAAGGAERIFAAMKGHEVRGAAGVGRRRCTTSAGTRACAPNCSPTARRCCAAGAHAASPAVLLEGCVALASRARRRGGRRR